MATLKTILAGLGSHGRHWAGVCREHPDVEITGFVARTDKSRRRAAVEWGVPEDRLFPSLQAAIESVSVDFVLDVTPPAAHRDIALTSFDAGLPVLGEKPMSDNLETAGEMVRAEQKGGCLHMIAQQRRFDPQPRKTRQLLEDRVIGEPGQLDIGFYVAWADLPGTHYVKEPFMFLLDMGCHHFDMMRYVLGSEPVGVQVTSWNLPWGWHEGDASHIAVFEFPGGLRAIHRAMGCTNGKTTPWTGNWRIEGPTGSLTWEDGRIFVSHEHRTEQRGRQEVSLPDWKSADSTTAVLDEFLTAMKEGRKPECDGADNLKTMAMTFAALESAKNSGQRVDIA